MPEYGYVNCFQLILRVVVGHGMIIRTFFLSFYSIDIDTTPKRRSFFFSSSLWSDLGMNLKFPCQTSCLFSIYFSCSFFSLSLLLNLCFFDRSRWRRDRVAIVPCVFMFFFCSLLVSSVNLRWKRAHKCHHKAEQYLRYTETIFLRQLEPVSGFGLSTVFTQNRHFSLGRQVTALLWFCHLFSRIWISPLFVVVHVMHTRTAYNGSITFLAALCG